MVKVGEPPPGLFGLAPPPEPPTRRDADPIVLRVYGEPIPQGNKRPIRNQHTGRIQMVEGRDRKAQERFTSWRQGIERAARDWQARHKIEPIEGPLRVTVLFRLTRPASVSAARRPLPHVRPDVDKLLRAVFDSLKNLIWKDDAQVCEVHTSKAYAAGEPPGCTIMIERVCP